jgi:O-antigen ligase
VVCRSFPPRWARRVIPASTTVVTTDPAEKSLRLVAVLWVLYLLAPAKLITYYIPALRPLSWLPELLLLWCTVRYLRVPRKGPGFPAFTAFFWLIVFGMAVALVIGNPGLSRDILRLFYQYWLLGLVTLAFVNSPARASTLLKIYFFYLLYFGFWGLVSLKLAPLSASTDPGARIIVAWHPSLENRDAFGPLMVAGLVYSMYYYRAVGATVTRFQRNLAILSILLCGVGFITSFGRGAFLAFLVVGISMWLRSRRKIAILLATAAAIAGLAVSAPQLTQRYLASMQTITEQGMQEGTGEDRKFLWTIAWREFVSSPIVGVGAGNYGAAAQWVLGSEERIGYRYTRSKLWGRAVHSAPMTVISEYGLLGILAALWILVDFFRTNRRIRNTAAVETSDLGGLSREYVTAMAWGLNGAFVAYCVSGIFYELIYTPLIWNVIVLNRMLCFALSPLPQGQPATSSYVGSVQ